MSPRHKTRGARLVPDGYAVDAVRQPDSSHLSVALPKVGDQAAHDA